VARVTIVGAGGFVFPIRLSCDMLSFEELADAEIRLMDISEENNSRTREALARILKTHRLPAKLSSTTDLERALDGADHVVCTWQVGGIEAYGPDVEIPRKYGVDQPVGDTLGPGGVFRFLRSFPAYMKLADAVKRLCPDAYILNYANPMAMNCMAVNRTGAKMIGLCHSVQGTSRLLASELGIPHEELRFRCAGLNHQAWFTELRHRGEDVYPRLREVMQAKYPSPAEARAGGAHGETSEVDEAAGHGETYHQEKVRTEIMRTFGYFHTESSHHGSEYVPWFRKTKDMVDAYVDKRWDYYRLCLGHDYSKRDEWVKRMEAKPLTASEEYGARIVRALETDAKFLFYGTVPNWGPPGALPAAGSALNIPNVQAGAAVEVACLADGSGVRPVIHGPLPPACAGMNRASFTVCELAVEAAVRGDAELVHAAVAIDPLTSAILTLPQIRAMVDEMLEAERDYLPQFFG
jgi:alpha-galactosidase